MRWETMSGLVQRKTQKKVVGLVLTLLVAFVAPWLVRHFKPLHSAVPAPPPGYYKVTEFIDGDTLAVDMNGRKEKVRFIGVDTPETHDPRKAVQCYGQAAAAFTKKSIGEQPIRLEADPTNTDRDRYNRLLRYVYLSNGALVNAEIIKQGYGFAYIGFPFTKLEEFKSYQKQAQDQKLGLWGSCQPTPDKYGGFTSNDASPSSP